jgi:hypothetical protein
MFSSPPQLRALLGVLILVAAVCTRGERQISPADSHEHTQCWGPCPSGFRWAFLPTYNTLRFAFLLPPASATQWQATLSCSSNGRPAAIAQTSGNTTATIAPVGQVWRVPPGLVQPGVQYSLRLRLADAANRTINESVGVFARAPRPWEGLQLGRDQVVIPPFTPIVTANGSKHCCEIRDAACCTARVSVVGRNYSVSSAGLWEQVSIAREALGPVRILAAPVTLVAVAGGVEHSAAGLTPSTVSTSSDTAAVTVAEWQAGPLTGTTTASYDYDGCVKLTISVEPTPTPIQELVLRVPLKDEEAPLFHTVTDYLRDTRLDGCR